MVTDEVEVDPWSRQSWHEWHSPVDSAAVVDAVAEFVHADSVVAALLTAFLDCSSVGMIACFAENDYGEESMMESSSSSLGESRSDLLMKSRTESRYRY